MKKIEKNVDILLVIPPFHRRNGSGKIFPMGTGYIVSSLIEADISWDIINCTEIIDSCYEDDICFLSSELRRRFESISPKIIGIGPCITSQLKSLISIVEVCHSAFPDIPLFAGGPFASIKGQENVFFNIIGIDYLIKGDGEKAVVEAVQMVKKGHGLSECEYVSYKGKNYVNCIANLDDVPFPYRPDVIDVFSLRRKNAGNHDGRIMPMIASRGCMYSCNYCVSGNMKKSDMLYRRRSYPNILSEMTYLKERFDTHCIVFYDDCFFPNPKTINTDVKTFCKLLLAQNLDVEWQIELRTDAFCELTHNSIYELKSAGCTQINLGIEKFTREGLVFLGKTAQSTELAKQVKIVSEIGIQVSATFILGGEMETEGDIRRLVAESKKLGLAFAQFNPLFIYPGTPLYFQKFSDDTEWVKTVLSDTLPWGEIVYESKKLSASKLLELVDFAYEEFYKGSEYEEYQMIEDRFNIKGKGAN